MNIIENKINKEYYSNYGYSNINDKINRQSRPEYPYIVKWVNEGSKVLDLGCGDGSLGELLINQKKCEVYGIEISENGVEQSKAKGVKAVLGDIDSKLDYQNKSFDFVIINVTLQMVYRPEFVLSEAIRVGKKVIVSFPNFAHWFARLELLLLGRFPKRPLYGYEWYNTRHIHLFSVNDFKKLIKSKNMKISDEVYFGIDSRNESFLAKLFPNLFSMVAIIEIE